MKPGSPDNDKLVTVDDLRFAWTAGGPAILAIDNFAITAGERVFLRGASGSGKTTLLSLLGGVVLPDAGSITVAGQSLSTLGRGERDRFRADNIGFIFQMFNLVPYLSLIQNVALPCRFSASREQRATANNSLEHESERLLSQLGLPAESLHRKASELSVGQQQRVAAARALLGSPPLIIADEPTSSLDADAREVFVSLLFDECERSGSTLLFVSHDRSLADLFDRNVDLSDINLAQGEA